VCQNKLLVAQGTPSVIVCRRGQVAIFKMDKKVVQTPLMKMLNPLYHFDTKEAEERDFQAIRMYKMDEGSTVCKPENLVGTDIFVMEEQLRQEEEKFQSEQKSPVSKESTRDKFCKPYRRDVEVIRVLKRMHVERVSKVRLILNFIFR
jgi:hypothetical protein